MDSGTGAPYTSSVDSHPQHLTWVEVDLAAIEDNARVLKQITQAALMAVVKANAYGHGAVETSQAAIRGGASWLGVARPSEGLQLRKAGIETPILLLSPAPPEWLDELIGYDISLTVGEAIQIDQAAAASESAGRPAKAHLKLDTGMSRIGSRVADAVELARLLSEAKEVSFEGLFTHFARADEADPTPTDAQLKLFNEAVGALESEGLRPGLIHAANSAATISRPSSHFDLVRCGIALYGLHPSNTCRLTDDFSPALQWKAQLVRVRTLDPRTGVSYGHEYVTSKEERIGTMPVGYADGMRRMHGNQALVRGRRVPVVGRVCMDLSMLLLDAVPNAREGDEVVLIGRQDGQEIAAEEVARRWDTINYEVTCGIGPRVPRLFS